MCDRIGISGEKEHANSTKKDLTVTVNADQ